MEMPTNYRGDLCVEMSRGYCNKTELREKEKIGKIILGGNNLPAPEAGVSLCG